MNENLDKLYIDYTTISYHFKSYIYELVYVCVCVCVCVCFQL